MKIEIKQSQTKNFEEIRESCQHQLWAVLAVAGESRELYHTETAKLSANPVSELRFLQKKLFNNTTKGTYNKKAQDEIMRQHHQF